MVFFFFQRSFGEPCYKLCLKVNGGAIGLIGRARGQVCILETQT